MWVLDLIGFLIVIGFTLAMKNLLRDVWRDSTLVDEWARTSVQRRSRY